MTRRAKTPQQLNSPQNLQSRGTQTMGAQGEPRLTPTSGKGAAHQRGPTGMVSRREGSSDPHQPQRVIREKIGRTGKGKWFWFGLEVSPGAGDIRYRSVASDKGCGNPQVAATALNQFTIRCLKRVLGIGIIVKGCARIWDPSVHIGHNHECADRQTASAQRCRRSGNRAHNQRQAKPHGN